MEIKWLSGDELAPLNNVIATEGWTPLNKGTVAVIATDEHGLAGFLPLRLIPHAEPLWVRPDLRGHGIGIVLANAMKEFLASTGTKGVVVLADDPTIAKLCESFGMRKVLSPVYILD